MKELKLKVNEFPVVDHENLLTIFKHTLFAQLRKTGLDILTVTPYKAIQGSVTLNCSSAYDEIRVEQMVLTTIRTINKFSSSNVLISPNFKDILTYMSKNSTDKTDKRYYIAIRELIGHKLNPPMSLQESIINEYNTLRQSEDKEAVIANVTEMGHLAQGGLIYNTWLWNNVLSKKPNEELMSVAALCCDMLMKLNVTSIQELELITRNTTRHVRFVGTKELYRIALLSEVQNSANIKNLFTRKIEIYNNKLDRYLTAVCNALFVKDRTSFSVITELLTESNSGISYDLRFCDVAALKNISSMSATDIIIAEKWAQIINSNIDNVVNILSMITAEAPRLINQWRASTKDIEYPVNLDSLQVYYEQMGVDIDTLDALMSIDAEEGNVKQMLQAIKKFGVHSEYDKIPYDIACKALKQKTISLSEKQMAVIEKKYASIMRSIEMAKTIDAAECVALATELLNKYKDKLNETVKNIAEKTLSYRICTEKQLEVMRNALVTIKNQEAIQENSIQINEGGLMFSLPTGPTIKTPEKQKSTAEVKTTEVDPVAVKNILARSTADAYASAYGDAQETSSNNDSIWDD